ncbi:MAG: septation protein IspZ [Cyanobium sp. MAG06]|nr:septation protein IspZ [Cyanobium sp. MAG06]
MILGVFTIKQFYKVIFDLLLEFGPIFVFIISFEFYGDIFFSTTLIMFITILVVLLSYMKERRLPLFAIFFSILVLLFGYLTIYFQNPSFIQAKDTIQDIIIATIFLICFIFKYPIIHKMFGHILPLSAHSYSVMTINWIIHFYFLAILNELVRHNVSVDYWVYYKMFSTVFTIGHGLIMLYIYRVEIKAGYRTEDFKVK